MSGSASSTLRRSVRTLLRIMDRSLQPQLRSAQLQSARRHWRKRVVSAARAPAASANAASASQQNDDAPEAAFQRQQVWMDDYAILLRSTALHEEHLMAGGWGQGRNNMDQVAAVAGHVGLALPELEERLQRDKDATLSAGLPNIGNKSASQSAQAAGRSRGVLDPDSNVFVDDWKPSKSS